MHFGFSRSVAVRLLIFQHFCSKVLKSFPSRQSLLVFPPHAPVSTLHTPEKSIFASPSNPESVASCARLGISFSFSFSSCILCVCLSVCHQITFATETGNSAQYSIGEHSCSAWPSPASKSTQRRQREPSMARINSAIVNAVDHGMIRPLLPTQARDTRSEDL